MAAPSNLRVGIVATRLGGTDGVSLEVDAWTAVLREFGHEVHFFTGLAETPLAQCTLVPLAFFGHPEVERVTASIFGPTDDGAEHLDARLQIEGIAQELRHKLERFVADARPDLLIAENTLSLPVHVPLGLAISRLAAAEGRAVLAHHHDLPWERVRFASNTVQDYLDEAFPPRLPNVHHACINSQQRRDLERRIGRTAWVIPNVIDMERPSGSTSVHRSRLRRELGLADGELFVLQPTRVVPRKGIEDAIELVHRLQRPATLVVTGASGDEGREYGARLAERARLLGVRVVWASDLVGARRLRRHTGVDAYSLDDVFEAADLVTYPSRVEGFGRAVLAAIRHRRLFVVNRYPIYDRDIRPLGVRAIELDGCVSDDAMTELHKLLDDAEMRARWADHNEALVRRHFSTDVLRRELGAVLGELFGWRSYAGNISSSSTRSPSRTAWWE